MNKNRIMSTFKLNHKALVSMPPRGDNPPPKNNTVERAHINKMFALSPRKNKAKPIEEYSTKYPATNSASASGKSNGCLFVSAKAEAKNMINKGNNGIHSHTFCCINTISLKLSEPTHNMVLINTKPIDTSYDTICAADLKAPKKAYLELLAHPDIKIPYTPKVDTAKIYNIPIPISAPTIL